MQKKLWLITAGLAVIAGLEASGIPVKYVDEIQQYLKCVLSVYLASDSTGDIVKTIVQHLSTRDVKSSSSSG